MIMVSLTSTAIVILMASCQSHNANHFASAFINQGGGLRKGQISIMQGENYNAAYFRGKKITSTSLFEMSSTATPSGTSSSPVMGGVSEFEQWYITKQASFPKHSSFQDNSLRGLEYVGGETENIIKLPASLVLRAKFGSDDDEGKNWDTYLSLKLLKECQKGERSDIYGYCSLLMKGETYESSTPCPPSTAPDALRNWTPDQKKLLESSSIGQRLLTAETNQQQKWSQKYDTILSKEEKAMFSKDQFFWAMEAVHSRAFKGSFGLLKNNNGDDGISLKAIGSIAPPILAAIVGSKALLNPSTNPNDDKIAIGCGIIATLPLLFNTIFSNDEKDNSSAVMLPLIDSANHMEKADSVIEFDPLKDIFTLSVGSKCLVKEKTENGNEKTQLYVSYGKKKDTELLLNYGFLNDFVVGSEKTGKSANEADDTVRDRVRRYLAEEFVRRNP